MSHRSSPAEFEHAAYLASRTTGDVRAARRGPAPLARRYAHRVVARTVARALFRAFRTR